MAIAGLALASALFASSQVQAGELLFFHNDHLGTAQVITDESQTVVWQGEQQPFGEVSTSVSSQENPTRLPGQYYDGESGLHYNYFRDYDPTLGRYVQSDPIGLQGGVNTYAYVNANPLLYADPNGQYLLFYLLLLMQLALAAPLDASTAPTYTATWNEPFYPEVTAFYDGIVSPGNVSIFATGHLTGELKCEKDCEGTITTDIQTPYVPLRDLEILRIDVSEYTNITDLIYDGSLASARIKFGIAHGRTRDIYNSQDLALFCQPF